MNWFMPVAAVSLFILTFAACGGGDSESGGEIRVYVVTLEVVDEDGVPVNRVNVAGGDIFGSTEQGGTLERAMVDGAQFRKHLGVPYRVEKSGCTVDQQLVRIDGPSDNLATITLQLACITPD